MPYRSTPNKLPIRRIKRRTIIFFTLSTIIIVLGIAFSMFVTLAKISDQKESKLMESSATELTLVMNNYLEERESECNDVFRNEVISSYAPFVNTTGETEFDREQHKSNVKKELSNISAGKGYNDFFIVYSTSEAVGNVSQGAFELVSTKGYQAYSDMLGGAGDLWSFGDLLGPNKLFYLRRMNDSSIFVMSCYIDNLEKIFPANDKVSIVEYILADENEKVIISDLKDVKTGEKVPERYTSLFKSGNEAVVDDFYTGAKTVMNCGWYVYAVTENSDFVPNYTIILTIACIGLSIVVLFTLLTGVLAFLPLTKANDQLTGSEYLDAITGRLNEYGLDEMISEMLETSLVGSTYAFIMIGIKDSEQIKSTVSLGYWNDIRTSLADKAESFFAERIHHIGRAYDDYIVIFADYSEFDLFKAHNELRNGCEQLLESFRDFVVGEDGSLKLNVVIGASVYPDDGDDFDTLLGKARQAYKAADKKEGSAFSIYKNNSANGSKESSK